MTATDPDLHRTVRERLHQVGQRYTNGRQELVEALRDAPGPVTLPALLSSCDRVPQSSAYRNLLVMEQAGVVRRLVHSTGHASYELAEDLTHHHHHLVCEGCGTIRDVELGRRLERSLDRTLHDVAASAGFTASHHSLDVFGLCADCSSG
jgi:Fe2+ or Zn2+ uptake regulation protein